MPRFVDADVGQLVDQGLVTDPVDRAAVGELDDLGADQPDQLLVGLDTSTDSPKVSWAV